MVNSSSRGIWEFVPVFASVCIIYKICQTSVIYFINQEATKNKNRIQNCINGVVNIGIKQTDGQTDLIGSGFFIMDESFDGLVQKVKDKRNEKEAKKGNEGACYDMILTNFHVVRDLAKQLKPDADSTSIDQIFASEKSGMDISLHTGSPSAIRKS